MHVINTQTKEIFRDKVKNRQEFDDLVLFTKENDNSGIQLTLVGYDDHLIKKVSELVKEKMKAINSVILKEKEALADFYNWKYKKALANEFEGDENQLIIEKHEAQIAATDSLIMKINMARDGVMLLIEAEEFDKAEAALNQFRSFGGETTEQDIEAVIN